MDSHRISLLRVSFALVTPIAEPAAALFYRRLMEVDPSTKALFAKTDLVAQGAKLIQALAMAVEMLDQPQHLVPMLSELARRHVGYGVHRTHYGSVGAALLFTLQEGLGEAFTPEIADAWMEAYAILADVMMDAGTRSRPREYAAELAHG